MKTAISSAATESFESVKRVLYSFEVLIIGVVIPFLFLIGINTNLGNTTGTNDTGIHQKKMDVKATGYVAFLSDQHR